METGSRDSRDCLLVLPPPLTDAPTAFLPAHYVGDAVSRDELVIKEAQRRFPAGLRVSSCCASFR